MRGGEGRFVEVWGGGVGRVYGMNAEKCERCGEVCWGVGRGEERCGKRYGGVGKCGGRCRGCGKMWVEMWKVSWGVGGGEGKSGERYRKV